jgi:hypothetical protein
MILTKTVCLAILLIPVLNAHGCALLEGDDPRYKSITEFLENISEKSQTAIGDGNEKNDGELTLGEDLNDLCPENHKFKEAIMEEIAKLTLSRSSSSRSLRFSLLGKACSLTDISTLKIFFDQYIAKKLANSDYSMRDLNDFRQEAKKEISTLMQVKSHDSISEEQVQNNFVAKLTETMKSFPEFTWKNSILINYDLPQPIHEIDEEIRTQEIIPKFVQTMINFIQKSLNQRSKISEMSQSHSPRITPKFEGCFYTRALDFFILQDMAGLSLSQLKTSCSNSIYPKNGVKKTLTAIKMTYPLTVLHARNSVHCNVNLDLFRFADASMTSLYLTTADPEFPDRKVCSTVEARPPVIKQPEANSITLDDGAVILTAEAFSKKFDVSKLGVFLRELLLNIGETMGFPVLSFPLMTDNDKKTLGIYTTELTKISTAIANQFSEMKNQIVNHLFAILVSLASVKTSKSTPNIENLLYNFYKFHEFQKPGFNDFPAMEEFLKNLSANLLERLKSDHPEEFLSETVKEEGWIQKVESLPKEHGVVDQSADKTKEVIPPNKLMGKIPIKKRLPIKLPEENKPGKEELRNI